MISDLDSDGEETLLASEGTSSPSTDPIPSKEPSFSGMRVYMDT